eukprot:6468037-Prymnesium_polylepis.1
MDNSKIVLPVPQSDAHEGHERHNAIPAQRNVLHKIRDTRPRPPSMPMHVYKKLQQESHHIRFGHDATKEERGAMRSAATYDPNSSFVSTLVRYKGTIFPM